MLLKICFAQATTNCTAIVKCLLSQYRNPSATSIFDICFSSFNDFQKCQFFFLPSTEVAVVLRKFIMPIKRAKITSRQGKLTDRYNVADKPPKSSPSWPIQRHLSYHFSFKNIFINVFFTCILSLFPKLHRRSCTQNHQKAKRFRK